MMLFCPASNLSLAKSARFSYDLLQQHPSRLSTMRTRGVTSSTLTNSDSTPRILSNTPAMPLNDAHFGGFFVSEVCR